VVGTALFGLIWLIEIVGDPSGGFAFFMLILAAPLVAGIGLVIGASRRRDLFGTRGLIGSILVLAGSVTPDIVGFVAVAVGLVLIAVSLPERAKSLLVAIVILLIGVIGLALRLESGDGILIFVPVLAVGTGVLATSFQRLAS
jgi:hypothetical protein